ncbi:hypothetical protein ElyMa_005454600 [Elysia marginata]|uniref:Uncharacterized protein n=1 Tax=Elysia marginata TaxID=1093978 RepID=A0AAV4EMP5_9GAST|nr:hypothetical protein ElyMa_005454600 [Elysia marginata]
MAFRSVSVTIAQRRQEVAMSSPDHQGDMICQHERSPRSPLRKHFHLDSQRITYRLLNISYRPPSLARPFSAFTTSCCSSCYDSRKWPKYIRSAAEGPLVLNFLRTPGFWEESRERTLGHGCLLRTRRKGGGGSARGALEEREKVGKQD